MRAPKLTKEVEKVLGSVSRSSNSGNLEVGGRAYGNGRGKDRCSIFLRKVLTISLFLTRVELEVEFERRSHDRI